MSQPVPGPETGPPEEPAQDDTRYPPGGTQAQQEQPQQGESNFTDGSGALFSMYLERAEEEDIKMAESWKGDADGMLVFTGLFSAAVAALLAFTAPNLQPNSQDISAYYLATIAHYIAETNGAHIPIPSSLNDPSVPFVAPGSAVWVNGLWFLSLVVSLTCAVLATLLQQWARRYLRVAYPRYSPHKRARIRAFYAHGVEKLHLPWVVEALPALLHIALFLFFAGLAVYLFTANHTIFNVVIAWVGLCVILYAYLTVLPIRHKDSPYAGPLSALMSFCLTGIRSTFFHFIEQLPRVPAIISQLRNRDANAVHLDDFFSHSMSKTAEKFALKLGHQIDYDSLWWTFQSLDEDQELEEFFEGIPGLYSSKALGNVHAGFVKPNEERLSSTLIDLVTRTLSSNLVSETVKLRRVIICTKAIEATSLLGPWWTLRRVLIGEWQKFLECVEFGLFVQNWKRIGHPVTVFHAQCVAAITISSVQEHDDRWYQLATGPMSAFTGARQYHLSHSDSTSLVNTNFIIRRTIQTFSGSAERYRDDILSASSKTFEYLRKFGVSKTSSGLQHEFCDLWNQLVELAQNDERDYIVRIAVNTLKNIRKLYIKLHEKTESSAPAFSCATGDADEVLDAPKSYCKCIVAGHAPSEPEKLQIDEPAVELSPNPDISPGIPPAYSHTPRLPQDNFLLSPARAHVTTQTSQPTHNSASHENLPTSSTIIPAHTTPQVSRSIPTLQAPSSRGPQVPPGFPEPPSHVSLTFPLPQVPPTTPLDHQPSNGIAYSTPSLASTSSSSLNHIPQ